MKILSQFQCTVIILRHRPLPHFPIQKSFQCCQLTEIWLHNSKMLDTPWRRTVPVISLKRISEDGPTFLNVVFKIL
jgi:hypothetical protein